MKNYQVTRNLVTSLCAGLVCLTFAACGSGKKSGAGGFDETGGGGGGGGGNGNGGDQMMITGTLRIAKLGAGTTGAGLSLNETEVNLDRVPQSETQFGIAAVDGYIVNVTHFHMSSAGGDHNHFEVEIGENVDLARTSGSTFEAEIDFPIGSFGSIGIKNSSTAQVKAFCRINGDEVMYTTSSGAVTIPCPDGDCVLEGYDFMESQIPSSQGGIHMEGLIVQIEEDSSPQIAVLANISYAMTCWNGDTGGSASGFSTEGTLPPFVWGSDEEVEGLYPKDQEHFAIYDLPAFVFMSADSDEALPTVETYLMTVNEEVADNIQLEKANFYSFVFRESGDFYGAIGLHFGDSVSPISRFFDNEAIVNGSEITVYSGNGLWSPELHPDRTFIRGNNLSFTRSTIEDGTIVATVEDGEDCDQSFINWAGHDEKADCMDPSDEAHYFPEVYMRRLE